MFMLQLCIPLCYVGKHTLQQLILLLCNIYCYVWDSSLLFCVQPFCILGHFYAHFALGYEMAIKYDMMFLACDVLLAMKFSEHR